MPTDQLFYRALSLKNFLSFGNKEITIKLDGDFITVVLGENLDDGGEDSRNGVGKSAVADALSYVVFGTVTRDGVSNKQLINKLARRGQAMLVTLRFDKGEYEYLIERGEKPSRLTFLRRPAGSTEDWRAKDEKNELKFDRSQNKDETNEAVRSLFGYDHTLFEYLVVNSTESTDYFKLTEDKRRKVVESLFGITKWAKKAKILKEDRRDKNRELVAVESAADATKAANLRIKAQIDDLETKSRRWERQKKETITELRETIELMESVDATEELELLKLADEAGRRLKELSAEIRASKTQARGAEESLLTTQQKATDARYAATDATESLAALDEGECPTCKQHWEPEPDVRKGYEATVSKGEKTAAEADEAIEGLLSEFGEAEAATLKLEAEKKEIEGAIEEIEAAELTYESIEEAAGADTLMKSFKEQFTTAEADENPHTSGIKGLKTDAIQIIDVGEIEDLKFIIKHYNYMIDLLTQKDSFMRRLIIEQWLPELNNRMGYWLERLGSPHEVEFCSDMTATIRNYGQEFPHGLLSKGQRNRVRMAENFSFIDVFEYMNYPSNLLIVDELVDNGTCAKGAEDAVDALQEICHKRNKRVFLVTHRDDIAAKTDDIMTIQLENKQSKIIYDDVSRGT